MFEKLTLVVDIDGTLCKVKEAGQNYEDLIPFPNMLEKLKYYKENGARIVLNTSRNMNTYNGNIGLINANTAKVLLAWLDKWNIPYDEIVYGKPWPGHHGYYVDDRAIRPDEFLKYNVDEIEKILAESKREIN